MEEVQREGTACAKAQGQERAQCERIKPVPFCLGDCHFTFFFKSLFIYFLERKHQCVAVSCTPPTGDLACNPGMRPGWEWNWRPFDLQASTQPLSHTSQGLVF